MGCRGPGPSGISVSYDPRPGRLDLGPCIKSSCLPASSPACGDPSPPGGAGTRGIRGIRGRRQEGKRRFRGSRLGSSSLAPTTAIGGLLGGAGIRAASRKALPEPHPSVPPAHWMVHLSRSRAWPSRRTLALMYLRSLLTLGRRAKGETMP